MILTESYGNELIDTLSRVIYATEQINSVRRLLVAYFRAVESNVLLSLRLNLLTDINHRFFARFSGNF